MTGFALHEECSTKDEPGTRRSSSDYDRFQMPGEHGSRGSGAPTLVIPFHYGLMVQVRIVIAQEPEDFSTNVSAAGIDFASVTREPGS